MPTVMRQGRLSLPVLYENWAEWRDEQPDTGPAPRCLVPGGRPCPICWGQGRILAAAANGEGLVSFPCSTCAGAGSVEPA